MKRKVQLEASNGIVFPRKLLELAEFVPGQTLFVSAECGRITLKAKATCSGRIIKRGKLKIWTGSVPNIPLEVAGNWARHIGRKIS